MSNMNSNFFWFSNVLLVGGRLVRGWCIWSVVGWSVIGGQWSVGRLVGGFKETRKQREAAVRIETKSSSV